MSTTLFLKELKGSLFSSGVIAAVLALYIVCIVYMFDPEIAESLDLIMATMPELYAAFGMANATDTLLGFLLNYLYGFVFTWLPLLMIMILVNRMVVRPIDRGSMAYLLASPTSRLSLALTFALTLATMLAALMVVIVALQVACAEAFFRGTSTWRACFRPVPGSIASGCSWEASASCRPAPSRTRAWPCGQEAAYAWPCSWCRWLLAWEKASRCCRPSTPWNSTIPMPWLPEKTTPWATAASLE